MKMVIKDTKASNTAAECGVKEVERSQSEKESW